MKKILLFLCSLSFVISTNNAFAQNSFSLQHGDTARGYYASSNELQINNYIKSNSGNVILNWRIAGMSLAPKWKLEGICDNYICYYSNSFTPGAVFQSDPYGTAYEDFHVIFKDLDSAANNTSSWVRLTLKDTINTTGTVKNVTFIGYKNPQGVGSVATSFDDITVFPNPARDAVNVIFDEKAGVKTIAIYNLIGKVINVYKPTNNGSAKLEIEHIPSGVYFLRLMDGQGHIVATRRFTRQ